MRARSPRWANESRTQIDCEIDHPALGWIPFTASPDDCEAHGRELFEQLSKGKVAPVSPERIQQLQAVAAQASQQESLEARIERLERLLQRTDAAD